MYKTPTFAEPQQYNRSFSTGQLSAFIIQLVIWHVATPQWMKSSRSNSGKVSDWSKFLNVTFSKLEFWSLFLEFFIKMKKMQKETCDAVLIFPPIRLSVLLIDFREKSRGCIESSQIFEF